jgi:hypothetical protein
MEQIVIVENYIEVTGSVGFYIFTLLKNIYWKYLHISEEWKTAITVTI